MLALAIPPRNAEVLTIGFTNYRSSSGRAARSPREQRNPGTVFRLIRRYYKAGCNGELLNSGLSTDYQSEKAGIAYKIKPAARVLLHFAGCTEITAWN